MLHYDSGSNKFELYSGNKIYNGDDGTKLGYTGSTSITVPAYVDTLGYRTGSIAVIGRSAENILFAPGITGSSQFSGSIQEVRYWANLLKVFYVNNKIEYPDDKEYRTKFLKLVYLNLTYRVNILEFLHACSFNLKVNLKIFGDKHVTEYVEIRHDIEYDKNIWKKMRAKDMNKLFFKAENIKKNDDNVILN